jgi:hypothetical protein
VFKVAAIPTMYAGVQFRSRLEARWAAFFDLLGWKWDYEPIDLAGYIPDFLVRRPLGELFLVEVKPFADWPCAVLGCIACTPSHGRSNNDPDARAMLDEAILKIQRSGWRRTAMIVGAVLADPRALGVPRLGLAVDTIPGESLWFETDTVVTRCRRCPAYLAQPDIQEWGVGHDCDDSERASIPIDPTALWREAGNVVQWKAAR